MRWEEKKKSARLSTGKAKKKMKNKNLTDFSFWEPVEKNAVFLIEPSCFFFIFLIIFPFKYFKDAMISLSRFVTEMKYLNPKKEENNEDRATCPILACRAEKNGTRRTTRRAMIM